MMSGSDGWPAHEEACWGAPVGLRLAVECLSREPPFSDYVSKMAPLPHINAVGNCGFIEPGVGFIPSAHCHDDPREPSVARTYARRATRLIQLLASSGYRVLFVYTLRLRDLYSPKHVCSIAAELPKEVARLRKTLSRCWPELDWQLLLPVLGQLRAQLPEASRLAVEASLRRIEEAAAEEDAEGDPRVVVERIADAPAGPHPMDGFWGDDAAWSSLFARHPVEPRDFSESCFAAATKAGEAKGAKSPDDESQEDLTTGRPVRRDRSIASGVNGESSKFQRFVDSLGMIRPS
ncbi:unnamed protein product [Polarella glacialis]|uniref:Uncharacterized protein n=1 Tax=Polarella glacialis TaxID=89957 RepID=A0A813JWR1_POLGL|nr:unnamed protein product [Polarella glacialis]